MEQTKEKKPRIIITTDSFLPRWDGVARFLNNIIKDLTKEFEVTVIAPDFGIIEQKQEYHLIRIPLRKKRYGDIRFAKLKYWLIKKEIKKADLVFNQTIGPIGVMSIIAAKRLNKKVISFTHSIESELVPMALGEGKKRRLMYIIMRLYSRWIYNKPDLLITPSEWVDDQLSWQGIRTKREVVKIGVDTKKFSPGTAKTIRTKIGCEEEDIIIGHVGRLAREKDIRTIIRGFVRTRKKYPRTKLLVIAKGLIEIEKSLSEKEGVIYLGSQNEVVPYYRAMDIFVMASLTETTCLAALEAMSCGKPIISTPVGFVKDYVIEGKNGLFFPKKDSYKLSQQIEKLIKNPELRKKMGEEARKTVEKNFQWSETAKKIIAIIKREIKSEE